MSCFPSLRNLLTKKPPQQSQIKSVGKTENGKVKAMVSKFQAKEIPGQLPPAPPPPHKTISRECVTELKNNLQGKIKFGIHSPYSIQNQYLAEAQQICCFVDEEEGMAESMEGQKEQKIIEANKQESGKVADKEKLQRANPMTKKQEKVMESL